MELIFGVFIFVLALGTIINLLQKPENVVENEQPTVSESIYVEAPDNIVFEMILKNLMKTEYKIRDMSKRLYSITAVRGAGAFSFGYIARISVTELDANSCEVNIGIYNREGVSPFKELEKKQLDRIKSILTSLQVVNRIIEDPKPNPKRKYNQTNSNNLPQRNEFYCLRCSSKLSRANIYSGRCISCGTKLDKDDYFQSSTETSKYAENQEEIHETKLIDNSTQGIEIPKSNTQVSSDALNDLEITLEKLKTMYEKGLISEEEYQSMRKKNLGL